MQNKIQRSKEIEEVLKEQKRDTMWKDGNIIEGRVAECCYCHQKFLSEDTLPFFKQHPERDVDEFYCGCRGWD